MESKRELTSFMIKKTREARGEVCEEKEDSEETICDTKRAVKMEAGAEDVRAAKAIMIFRIILNLLFIIPLALAIVALFGYILIRFLPSVLSFIKNLLIALMKS